MEIVHRNSDPWGFGPSTANFPVKLRLDRHENERLAVECEAFPQPDPVTEWCDEQFGVQAVGWEAEPVSGARLDIYFRSVEDALLFSLRWMGG